MMKLISLLSLLATVLSAGCADPYRNLYEGMQQREGIVNPAAKPAEKAMPYEQYKDEREKLQHQDSEKSHAASPAN